MSDDNMPKNNVRAATSNDLPAIRQILNAWIVDPQNIEHTIQVIKTSLDSRSSSQFVVVELPAGEVAGIMGMTSENISPELFKPSDNPVELVNAYIDPNRLGKHLGTALADHLEELAITQGFTKLIIVSGSRNRDYGYPFWSKRYGKPAFTDDDFYGAGQERVVWTKSLKILN